MTPSEHETCRSAIRHLQSIYNNSGDRGRIDDLVKVFAETGALEVPGERYEGRAAIAGFMKTVSSGTHGGTDLKGSRHHLTTNRVEIDSSTEAHAWAYFFVMRHGTVLQEGLYVDRYVRMDDAWLILERRVKIIWDS